MVPAFVAGLLAGILAVVTGIFLYFRLGIAPVGTAAAPMLFEKALAKAALHARLRREMPAPAPIAPDQGNLTAGAQVYLQNCAVCHGLLKQPATAIARGMFPRPPQLFIDMVTDDPEGEIYWKTKGRHSPDRYARFRHISFRNSGLASYLVAQTRRLHSSRVAEGIVALAEPGRSPFTFQTCSCLFGTRESRKSWRKYEDMPSCLLDLICSVGFGGACSGARPTQIGSDHPA
jgi:thiosulfate dehydrogenase